MAMAGAEGFYRFKALYFIMYAGFGVFFPYIPIFFELLEMTKAQIGVLCMLPNIAAFMIAPVFSIIGDIFQAHYEVMFLCLVVSVALTMVTYICTDFLSLFLIVLISSAFRAPITPQVDAMVIEALPDKARYGEMRLWGAISFGLLSLAGGAITSHHHITDFKYVFFLHAVSFLLAGLIILSIVYDNIRPSNLNSRSDGKESNKNGSNIQDDPSIISLHDDLPPPSQSHVLNSLYSTLVNKPSILAFALVVFLSGIGSGVIDTFLFLRLKSLGGSGLVMGLSRLVTCMAEVPMFQISGYLHNKYGTWIVMSVTQLAFVLRFTYYSSLSEPWWVLPCEVLHGLTFATMWSVSCAYANNVAPNDCKASVQAVLEGLHWGLGSGLGAVLGGLVYDGFGAVWLFEMSAVLSFMSFLLACSMCYIVPSDAVDATGGESNKGGYTSVVQNAGDEENSDEDVEIVHFTRQQSSV
jgi:predicted MFS family arabinose efflux permease